jgi:hypothetical protein
MPTLPRANVARCMSILRHIFVVCTVLASACGAEESAVVSVPDDGGGPDVIAVVALQDGFQGDSVVVAIDDRVVIDEADVTTDQRIGIAFGAEATVPAGWLTLTVQVANRELDVSEEINPSATPYIGISLLDGRIVTVRSSDPFVYG